MKRKERKYWGICGNIVLSINYKKRGDKMKERLMTSESVTYGHSDKFSDLVSNALMDEYLEGDSNSKVAIETTVFGNRITVGGEVTSKTKVDVVKVVQDLLEEVGYGYMIKDMEVEVLLREQSPEIFSGVVKEDGEIGAGDQGIMWGYASGNEFTNYMPYGAYLSHVLVDKLTEVRENGLLPYLRPDGKTQVTVIYDEDDRVVGVDSIVLSTMHTEEVSLEQLREDVDEYIITPVLEEHGEPINVGKHINTAGLFTLGFGLADAGLTGRKIVVDSYGGYAKHGGGNYNGKDASKVDRSGAYMARYLAKNILDDSKERFPELDIKDVEVQLGYAIGVIEPVSLLVNIYSHKNNERLSISDDYAQFIQDNISCTPKAIIDKFDLNNVKTKPLSVGGHFGKKGYKWEELDIEFKI